MSIRLATVSKSSLLRAPDKSRLLAIDLAADALKVPKRPAARTVLVDILTLGLLLWLACSLLVPPSPARAQSAGGAIYIVQPGDTLTAIAQRFNVSITDLMAANALRDPNALAVGQRLLIPGLPGVDAILQTERIELGDSYRSLVRRTQVDADLMRRLNRLVSPTEFYAGASLIVPEQAGQQRLSARFTLQPGESLLELAVRADVEPWALVTWNGLNGTWDGLPGDVLYTDAKSGDQQATGLPAAFASLEAPGLPYKQGGTAVIFVSLNQPATLSGLLVDHPLRFFPLPDGRQVALQGVHAMLEPGLYPLRVEATLADGSRQAFEQMVLVRSGYYPDDPDLYVDAATIDPSITEPENQRILEAVSAATPEKYWNGVFLSPASLYADVTYFTSRFGNRRTYYANGSNLVLKSFHSGVDYHGGTGLQITAPADGVVVLADSLTVRGLATIIDHGWGVYSGIWHQSEIRVQVGQRVQRGQVIGVVGGTGRVSGPHLHWELWVNGVQVEPLDWLQQAYP